jgi:predicted RNA-binding Zn-ribbon protein involved in translation (DUF1610 family)
MGKDPPADPAEVEIICPRCGYHLMRSAARLRRETQLVCPQCGNEILHPSEDDEAAPPPEASG